jgi:hypothetical protein
LVVKENIPAIPIGLLLYFIKYLIIIVKKFHCTRKKTEKRITVKIIEA